VTWRMVRPVRTAVSPKRCVAMAGSLLGVADDGEEDVFE
jgi:hypothetical protein